MFQCLHGQRIGTHRRACSNTNEPSADDMAAAFFASSSRGAKIIAPILAVIAVLGGAAYDLIPTINRVFSLNIPAATAAKDSGPELVPVRPLSLVSH
ncbi:MULTISPECIES: hypothetical protein [Corynebacterium]|uniref:hypothetical protein n=1 Tax=Corynebacterium TaxID=1716 RepID=UPI0011A34F50|nr:MULTISPECIES: hypothetical protein [Corynebacterium]